MCNVIPHPCIGPYSSVFRTRRANVPCRMSFLRFGIPMANYMKYARYSGCCQPSPSSRLSLDMCRAVPILPLLIPLSLNAQQITSAIANPRVLEQLVNEVRQLSLAIERTNSVSLRLQITLQPTSPLRGLRTGGLQSIDMLVQILRNGGPHRIKNEINAFAPRHFCCGTKSASPAIRII